MLATHCCHRVVESSFTGNLPKLEQLIKLLMQTWLKYNDMRPERFFSAVGECIFGLFLHFEQIMILRAILTMEREKLTQKGRIGMK